MKTTDGGDTWSSPEELNLSNFSELRDSVQQLVYQDSVTGGLVPLSTGKVTTGFDADLTVDANGNPHLFTTISSGTNRLAADPGPRYSIYGTWYMMYDITIDEYGDWNMLYISPQHSYVGNHGQGTGASIVRADVWTQVSRTEDGTKIFYSWTRF